MTKIIYSSNYIELLCGDVLEALGEMEDQRFQTCICSPPYWGLRDYKTGTWEGGDAECDHLRKNVRPDHSGRTITGRGHQGSAVSSATPYKEVCGICGAKRVDRQLGLEPTPEEYVEKMVEVFREIRRVLRDDGTLWMNFGDCYWSGSEKRDGGHGFVDGGKRKLDAAKGMLLQPKASTGLKLKPKDLVGMPWRVALALQADGWWLRSDCIWSKSNPMPESVTDRPTRSHEYLFLLTKSAKYFYDADAIREPSVDPYRVRSDRVGGNKGKEVHHSPGGMYTQNPQGRAGISKDDYDERKWADRSDGLSRPPMTMKDREYNPLGRNKRTVWTISTQPFPKSHFAVFPEALVEPCVLAGTSAKGCCPKCGAPWRRKIEKFDTGNTQKMGDGWATHEGGHGSFHREGREQGEGGKPVMASRTTGWEPTCDCPMHEANGQDIREIQPTDCWVLDPFCGTATVGIVALKHGQRFTGIDLSLKYLRELALPRLLKAEAKPIAQDLF